MPEPSPHDGAVRKVRETPRARRLARRTGLRLIDPQCPAGHRPAVLLAYQGGGTRRALTALLVRQGYDVTACANGRVALGHLKTGKFDLVVTGIMMTEMDGLELIRGLARRRASPPIVAVAENSDPMSHVYLRSAALFGAMSTHTAPIRPADFLASVDWIVTVCRDTIENDIR